MATIPTVVLKPVVRFREFPFGTTNDPSMRVAMASQPWPNQADVLDYLRSGLILGVTMGADLTDWFDPGSMANATIDGHTVGGTTEMTDGMWLWYAGLIHFIEKYNVHVPAEFIQYAAQHGWRVEKDKLSGCRYECSYFEPMSV